MVYWNGETPNFPGENINSARVRPDISAAFSCDIIPISYHLTAAASLNSLANAEGSFRSAENAPSGLQR